MVSRMRNLENAARLAMANADVPAANVRPAADGLVRRILAMFARIFAGG